MGRIHDFAIIASGNTFAVGYIMSSQERKLTVDFTRVKKLSPHLFELEEILGNILQIVAVASGTLLLAGMISRGSLQLGWEAFLIGYAVHIFAYARYLLRDKNKYQSNFGHKQLGQLDQGSLGQVNEVRPNGGQQEIQVDDYFDRELTTVISDILDLDTDKPFMYLGPRVFSSKSIRNLCLRLGIDDKALQQLSESWLRKYSQSSIASQQILTESLTNGFNTAITGGYVYYGTEPLFLTLLHRYIPEAARSMGIGGDSITALLSWQAAEHEREVFLKRLLREQLVSPVTKMNSSLTSVYAPTVETYCRDLTFEVSRKLRRSDGGQNTISLSMRTEQLNQLTAALATDEAMALITGPAGAGKTTLVNSLIMRILAELVPSQLLEKRVMELNLSMLLGQEDPKQITVLMQQIFAEVKRAGNIILYIDDLDQLLATNEELRGELTAMLAAGLREVDVKLVATVSDGSFERYLRQLPELSSLFTIIQLGAASKGLTVQILLDELDILERKYKVKAGYKAVSLLTDLSQKTDLIKVLPDKALDNLAICMQEARAAGLSYLDTRQVEEFFSRKTGAPLGLPKTDSDRQSIINLGADIAGRVIGQDEAVKQVAAVLQKARAGLNSPNKPQASFLFYGPTGAGKTFLSQTIADLYYGRPELMLRLDMSEFHEDENLARLLGQAVGNNYTDGVLTGFVQKNPYSLILLDEIEKANPKVLDLFLQVLDNAALLNGKGQKIDFSGCVIVATSNAGSREIAQGMAAGNSYKQVKPLVEEQLRKQFRMEFLNRFDAVIMFAPLSPVHAQEIVRKLLWEKKQELALQGIEFVFDDNLVAEITKEGFDQIYGARALKRAVQQRVDTRAAQLLLSGKLKSGDVFQL